MLYSTITAILFTAATVTAYQVPKGAKNGRYECYTDSKTGKEVHVYIGPLLDNVPKYDPKNDVPPNVGKRENEFHSAKFALRSLTGPNNIYCEHIYLNNVDTDNANNNLDAQCGNGAPTPSSENGRDKYSIAGGTVAYFCNMSGGTNHCYARYVGLSGSWMLC